MQHAGHTVYCVTMRNDSLAEATPVREALGSRVDGIFYTSRKAKNEFMISRGFTVDVWIDSLPNYVYEDVP